MTTYCDQLPIFRYTWPGQPAKYACLEHAIKIATVAFAMGFRFDFIPLTDSEQDMAQCSQVDANPILTEASE